VLGLAVLVVEGNWENPVIEVELGWVVIILLQGRHVPLAFSAFLSHFLVELLRNHLAT